MKLINYSLVKKHFYFLILFTLYFCQQSQAQGTWSNVTNLAPDFNGGVMLLLSDGTVITKTYYGGFGSTPGTTWDKLTPDASGSYINGTWSRIATMANDRLYFSTWVLNDGRVYVGGGEYGSGTLAEIYNPLTNSWSSLTAPGVNFSDGNSENLPNGKLLLGVNSGTTLTNYLYDPVANTYTVAPSCTGSHDEAAWLKLPDSSILQVDLGSHNAERYIPSTNTWIADSACPVMLYDSYGYEAGTALQLPDGRSFFIGSTSVTAFYTPSGNTNPGSWTTGPAIPSGLGAPDAAAAMMNNGNILMALSPTPTMSNHFPTPTSFYEFDYATDTFIALAAPSGGSSIAVASYNTNMLALPDGNILYTSQGNKRYYVYTPGSSALSAGKPTVGNITRVNCDTFTVTGTLFTGISEGASYGDDWSMSTNFPIVRLTSGSNVYYGRTYNWNRYGSISTGTAPDTTSFTLPAGLPQGTYSLQVVVNGNASAPVTFSTSLAVTPSSFSLCPGTSATLTDSASIGFWYSSNPSIAIAGSASGTITGVSAGTATISYAEGSCYSTSTVTINPLPSAISGSTSVCTGSSATLTSSPSGGTWLSTNTGITTIGSGTGLISAIAPGTDTVSYTISTGCTITSPVTVNPYPPAITGPGVVCAGSSVTFSNTTSGGTWSSGSAGVASAGPSSGVISGVSAGSAIITYTPPSGCYVITTVTVNALPSAISGSTSVCTGSSVTLSDAGGGTWAASPSGTATIGSASGVLSGITSGIANVTYSLPVTGCSTTAIVTVNPLPSAVSGPGNVCPGLTISLTDAGGGTWTSATAGVATIGSSSGIVTGVSSGTDLITYQLPTGCITTASVTVNPIPSAISGTMTVCTGQTTTLSDAGGGTWSSATPAVATIGYTSGIVTGVSAGTSVITYTAGTGCSVTGTVTTNPHPAAITGATPVYIGGTATLGDISSGGNWSSSNSAIASAGSSSGIITGISGGTATITYTLPTGCFTSTTFTVNTAPGPITGSTAVCQSSTTTLSDISTGGTWSSSNTAIATVGSATGVVNGVASGTANISYTISGTSSVLTITVYPAPAAITGASALCVGATTTLSDATGAGVWSSSATSVSTVGSATGIISGVSAGTVTLSYTTSCSSVIKAITINPAPALAAITGATGICSGSSVTLMNTTPGGTWTSGSSIATVGSTSGLVTGMAFGSTIITYSVTNSFACSAFVSTPITVEGTPNYLFTGLGTGVNSSTGDGGPATLATIEAPRAVCHDTAGNIYISDVLTNRIRKISVNGFISTVAGNGTAGNTGDGGQATAASLNMSGGGGLFVDKAGNILISNSAGQNIRKVNASTGIITTIAGIAGSAGFSGDGGPAIAAKLYCPIGVSEDTSGNIYIADASNNRIRKVDAVTGNISTVIGNGYETFSGDGGQATAASVSLPREVAADIYGNLYITDYGNDRIRKYVIATGIITTIAGNGVAGSAGDGGQATAAQLNNPVRTAFDGANSLYIVDQTNHKIRQVNLSTGIIKTVIGNGTPGFTGDGSPATSGELNVPCGIAINKNGDLYVADGNNHRVRVSPSYGSIFITLAGPASVPGGTAITFKAHSSVQNNISYQWKINGSPISGATNSTFTDASPSNGNIYTCVLNVAPKCGSSYNATSNSITVTTYGPPPVPTEVNSPDEQHAAVLYPNPFHGSFTLAAANIENGAAVIKVFDEIGKMVFAESVLVTGNQLTQVVDLQQLPAGVFLVALTDASGKLVILKCVKE